MFKHWVDKWIRNIRYFKNKKLRERIKSIALEVVTADNNKNKLQLLNENEDSVTFQPQYAVGNNLLGPVPSQIQKFMGELADGLNDALPIDKKIQVSFESITKSTSTTYGVSVTIL